MLDDVRILLARGIAAAKTGLPGSREEARLNLERVLHGNDAESGQKAAAWLWLSRIEEDPAEKRRCLESALAVDPGNGQAHQGLAILDGRLKPEDIVDPYHPVQPFTPDSSLSAAGVRRFVCPKCGGSMSFSAGQRSLACNHCGAALSDSNAVPKEEAVKEEDFFAALPTAKARLWECPIDRTLKCGGCGATFILPQLQASGECPFCRSTHVLTTSIADLIQPSAVLPFQFEREEAAERMRAWLAHQRFCPRDLQNAAIARPHGVYLPFWTFDLGGTTDWRALVAEEHGRTTQWAPVTGLYLVYADDLLVPASRSVPQEWADILFDFDTKALAPYSADFISGYTAEIYQIPLEEASLVARQRTLRAGRSFEQENSLAGKRYRDFIMNSAGMTVDSFKLALLPLWLGSYRYRDENFALAINGQSGTAAGRVPRNGLQRLLAGLFGRS